MDRPVTKRLTARDMAAGVRTGESSAAELVADALSGAAALDPALHFVDSLAPYSALEAAGRIDALPIDQREGLALAGVPFLAKAGTTAASPVVGRLVHAGAVLLGTSTRPDPAAACQAWGWNGREHTSNPWRTGRSSGGSSAGAAAAVAAGVIPVATGGDSAGSIRIPAAFCGVIGLKGMYGRVARTAGRTLAQLTVSGVIGADLADTVLAISIASGPDPRDPTALPPWPVPHAAGQQLAVGFSADLGRPLLGLQPVRPPGGHRPGRPARRPPGRVAGHCRDAPRRPGRGTGRACRRQPARSAGQLAPDWGKELSSETAVLSGGRPGPVEGGRPAAWPPRP